MRFGTSTFFARCQTSIGIFQLVLLASAALMAVQCTDAGRTPDAFASEGDELPAADGAALDFDDGQTVYVTASDLRSRSEPSIDGDVVGSFGNGEQLEILERSGEWLKVAKGARHVWVSARYVATTSPSSRQSFLAAPKRSAGANNSSSSTGHAWFGKRCKKGKPCGNACISVNRTCHK